MKKLCLILFSIFVVTGCSCSVEEGVVPTSTPETSQKSSEVTSTTKKEEPLVSHTHDFIEYIKDEFDIINDEKLENFDENILGGYSFELDDTSYYLVELDGNNELSSMWIESINTSNQIDVQIEGLTKSMYGLLNDNHLLISEHNDYIDGFEDHFHNFSYEEIKTTTNESSSENITTNMDE